jgi:hypothetical protein
LRREEVMGAFRVKNTYHKYTVVNLSSGNELRLSARGEEGSEQTILDEERNSPELLAQERKGRLTITPITEQTSGTGATREGEGTTGTSSRIGVPWKRNPGDAGDNNQ